MTNERAAAVQDLSDKEVLVQVSKLAARYVEQNQQEIDEHKNAIAFHQSLIDSGIADDGGVALAYIKQHRTQIAGCEMTIEFYQGLLADCLAANVGAARHWLEYHYGCLNE